MTFCQEPPIRDRWHVRTCHYPQWFLITQKFQYRFVVYAVNHRSQNGGIFCVSILGTAPGLTGVRIRTADTWSANLRLEADYTGDLPWGAIDQLSNIAGQEFIATSVSLFEELTGHTGVQFDQIGAIAGNRRSHPCCYAKAILEKGANHRLEVRVYQKEPAP